MLEQIRLWRERLTTFLRNRGGNVAMMFGLSIIPISIAAGAGVDLARAMAVKASMSDALDAAGLAVGSTPGMSQSTAQSLAQQYFNANFRKDSSQDSVPAISVTINGESVVISASDTMQTTVLKAINLSTLTVSSSTTVVWGQTKLWVALVLDNTGSMDESDSGGTKLAALKAASHQLLTLLQNASNVPGDVQVSIVPFSKDVKVSTSNVGASWIDWTDWEAPPGSPPGFSDGPGTSCPWSTSSQGYRCVAQPSSTTTVNTIPSSGTYKGYICPSVDNGRTNGGHTQHYYNGCYNSTAATQTSTSTSTGSPHTTTSQVCSTSGSNSTSTCTCSGYPKTTNSGSGNSTTVTNSTCSCSTNTPRHGTQTTTCTATNVATTTTTTTTTTNGWTHLWNVNAHSTWAGCIMDRTQDYDTTNTTPGSGSGFPAENTDYCPPATVMSLGYSWTGLSTEVDSMSSNGNTNQTVGLDHGMMTLVGGSPYSAPTLPATTKQYIILLSDGANTQNRWTTTQSSIDARMALACTNAKAASITVYTIFLDIGGASGNSTVLQNCASDSTKYFDLTTTGSVSTTFAAIGQQITSLRVSQ